MSLMLCEKDSVTLINQIILVYKVSNINDIDYAYLINSILN